MGAFFRKGWLEPQILGAVEHLRPLAESAGLTMSQFALAWVLREPSVAAPIIGATRPEQIEENAAASGRFVDPALFAKAELLLGDAAATS